MADISIISGNRKKAFVCRYSWNLILPLLFCAFGETKCSQLGRWFDPLYDNAWFPITRWEVVCWMLSRHLWWASKAGLDCNVSWTMPNKNVIDLAIQLICCLQYILFNQNARLHLNAHQWRNNKLLTAALLLLFSCF